MEDNNFYELARDLENAGLVWDPEIGDEVFVRNFLPQKISIIVDSGGMDIVELREAYVWMPTIEQMLTEIEARHAVLFHSGIQEEEGKNKYTVVLQGLCGTYKSKEDSFRKALAMALKELIIGDKYLLKQIC